MPRELVNNIEVDENGDVYVSGSYQDSILIDSIILSGYANNAFFTKMDSSGNIIWAKSFDSNSLNYTHISTIGRDKYVLCGPLTGSAYYNNNLIQDGINDFILAKLDSSGNLIWSKKIEYSQYPYFPYNLVTDKNNKFIYISGMFKDSLSIDSVHLRSNGMGHDIYIAKIDVSGNLIWLKSTSDNSQSQLGSLAVDSFGDVYLVGSSYPATLKWGSHTLTQNGVFLLKLSAAGNVIFSKGFGGKGNSSSYGSPEFEVNFSDISIRKKNIYIGGSFTKPFAARANDTLFCNGGRDGLVVKLDSTGKVEWYQGLGGGGEDHINKIAYLPTGSVIATGGYSGLSLFGTRTIMGIGNNDIFITKLSECKSHPPIINIYGDTSICANNPSVRLNTYNSLGYNFQWRKDGIILLNEKTPNFLPVDSGIYSVIVNDNGCKDTSRNVNISVAGMPIVSLLPFDTICSSAAPLMLLGGLPQGGSWSGQGVSNGYFDPSAADTGWVKITYSYSNGNCSDSAFQYMYVNAVPLLSISGQQIVCANTGSYSYSASGSANLSYKWSISGGSIASGQGSSSIVVDWGTAGAGIVHLTAVKIPSASPCDTVVLSDTIIIDGPHFNSQINGADTVCANTNGYIYSTQTPALSYLWQVKGGQVTSGLNTSSITVKWNSAGQGSLLLKLINSCYNDTLLHDTVFINAGPDPSFKGIANLCSGSKNVAYVADSSAPNLLWNVYGGSIVSGQGTDTVFVNWGYSGQGRVVLTETDAKGCSDTAVKDVQLQPAVYSNFQKDICKGESYYFDGQFLSKTGNYFDTLPASNSCDSIVKLDLTVKEVDYTLSVFTDSLHVTANTATFQWLACNSSTGSYYILPGETSASFVAQQAGSYAVAVNQNGCSDTSACYIVFPVGIDEITNEISLNIFPNPTNDFLNIDLILIQDQNIELNIFNTIGEKVIQKILVSNNRELKQYLSLGHLPKGIYILELKFENYKKLQKIVVQ